MSSLFYNAIRLFNSNRLTESLPLFIQSAEQGYEEALVHVCTSLYLGINGFTKNDKEYERFTKIKQHLRDTEAFKTTLQAAHSGDVEAMFHTGKMYFENVETCKNMIESLHWLEKAATHKHPLALLLLGDIYRHGLISGPASKNESKANSYYQKYSQISNTAFVTDYELARYNKF